MEKALSSGGRNSAVAGDAGLAALQSDKEKDSDRHSRVHKSLAFQGTEQEWEWEWKNCKN
jgi:hypothetical protein